jgi:hypothetical protein
MCLGSSMNFSMNMVSLPNDDIASAFDSWKPDFASASL